MEAWLRWPHAVVQLGERERGAVDRAVEAQGLKRSVGASVPNFSVVPALQRKVGLLTSGQNLVRARKAKHSTEHR